MITTITTFIDNVAGVPGSVGEHGFAAWITRGDTQILFDTGAGMALPINIEALKKNAQALRLIVLSHGHWDHTGGIKRVLELRDSTDILAHPEVFRERFSSRNKGDSGTYRRVGIPFSREELEAAGASFLLRRDYHEFADGMFFSGEIPRPQGWKTSDVNLLIQENGRYQPDTIPDDASLLIETDSGPVILLGCAHSGLDTILDYFAEKSGHTAFHAVIGGTHLIMADDQRIQAIIRVLEHYRVKLIATTHCTGFPAASALYRHFHDQFRYGHVGIEYHF